MTGSCPASFEPPTQDSLKHHIIFNNEALCHSLNLRHALRPTQESTGAKQVGRRPQFMLVIFASCCYFLAMLEDRLYEALPFLRPRIEEPTTIVLFVFVVLCLGIASLIGLYLWRQRRQRIELETRFSKVGTQKGLAPRQILYLLQLA